MQGRGLWLPRSHTPGSPSTRFCFQFYHGFAAFSLSWIHIHLLPATILALDVFSISPFPPMRSTRLVHIPSGQIPAVEVAFQLRALEEPLFQVAGFCSLTFDCWSFGMGVFGGGVWIKIKSYFPSWMVCS